MANIVISSSSKGSPEKKTKKLDSASKRILSDVISIMKHPLVSQGIHYFHDESNLYKGYAIIFGPSDTIYENGVYFFEFDFPKNYPFSPPKLNYLTNDGSTRFNPNLYRSGKVCISILNTWRGEQWTSCQTISSVLLTLITLFHNKPLLNEPGITERHRDFNKYNEIIQYKNYEIAIGRVAKKKLLPETFTEYFYVITEHFKKNKKQIIDNLEKLRNEYPECKHVRTGMYSMSYDINYEKIYNSIKDALSEYN